MTRKALQQLLLGKAGRPVSSSLSKNLPHPELWHQIVCESVPPFLPLTDLGVLPCCHFTVILLSCDCSKKPSSSSSIKKKACSELGSYLWMRTLGAIFLDHSLSAYIESVFYSEFIQVLKRLLKYSHDCQNAEQPFSMAQVSCVWVSAYPSTLRAATGRKIMKTVPLGQWNRRR